jgi:hypothetical protein
VLTKNRNYWKKNLAVLYVVVQAMLSMTALKQQNSVILAMGDNIGNSVKQRRIERGSMRLETWRTPR